MAGTSPPLWPSSPEGAELPPVVADGPTMRALVDALNDSALLLNDIFSYEREAADAAETSNMVLALQKFLGCGPEQAVAATNDLLTARLQQFDHIADVEIPEMCDKHHLTPEERSTVLGHVDGLRDWLPGWLEWHKRAARYAGEDTPDRSPVGPPVPPVSVQPPHDGPLAGTRT